MEDVIFVAPESVEDWVRVWGAGREYEECCDGLEHVARAAVWIPQRFNVALPAPTHDLVEELLAGPDLSEVSE